MIGPVITPVSKRSRSRSCFIVCHLRRASGGFLKMSESKFVQMLPDCSKLQRDTVHKTSVFEIQNRGVLNRGVKPYMLKQFF